MLPIQPWMIKGGAIVLVILIIFFAGWAVKGKMVSNKIERLKADYARAVEIIETCQTNLDRMDESLARQNKAIEDMAKANQDHIEAVRKASKEALRHAYESHQRAYHEAQKEIMDLQMRVQSMSAAEACHEAWMELADGD